MMDEELTAHAEKSDGYHGVIIRSPNRHGVTTYTKDRSVNLSCHANCLVRSGLTGKPPLGIIRVWPVGTA